MAEKIIIENKKERGLVAELEEKKDIKSERIKRLLKLPDLTKRENSPVKILVDQILKLPRFAGFDLIDFPRVVTVEENFDVLNTPKDHPSRSESDTYYLDGSHILRTQTTTMWPYYLRNKDVITKLEKSGEVGAL